jgi:hypothetical protein
MELILVVVILVLLFGGGGYWGRRRGHWQEDPSTTQETARFAGRFLSFMTRGDYSPSVPMA